MSKWRTEIIGDCTLIQADCLEVLPTLDVMMDGVITDPPYGVQLADWDSRVPHDMLAEFLHFTDGPIVWFGAAAQHRNDLLAFDPPPQRVCVWNPAFTLSKTMANGMAYRWHPVYCWQLPQKHDGPTWDVWRHNCDGRNWWNHPATKPLALIMDCVRFCVAGGIVFDPFMGSGTTGVACVKTGRRFIGIEREPKYFDIACRRIREAYESQGLFRQSEQAVMA